MNLIHLLSIALSFILTISQDYDHYISIEQWVVLDETTYLNDSGQIIGYDFLTDEIILFGGNLYPDEVSRFDPVTETYTSITETVTDELIDPEVRHEGYYQIYGDNMIYYLVPNVTSEIDMIYTFNIDDNSISLLTQKPNSSWFQTSPSLCIDEENMYMYTSGRAVNRNGGTQGEVQKYDMNTDEWTISSIMETERSATACAIWNNDVYLFGGITTEDDVVDIISQCEDGNLCVEITQLSGVRFGVEAVKVNDKLHGEFVVIIAGADAYPPTNPVAIVDIFDLANETVTPTASLNYARQSHSAMYSPIDSRIFVFNGLDVNDDEFNNIETTPLRILPSPMPTSDPTEAPTTDEPSRVPTDIPTTAEPTEVPTTAEPSTDPTAYPTMEPIITRDPTVYPTMEPTTSETESPEETESPTKKPYKPKPKDYETSVELYALVIVILVIICCLILLCFWWYDREEKKYPTETVMVAMVAAGGCYKCGQSDCNGTNCGKSCNKCGTTDCDGVSCGVECAHCGKTDCNGTQCQSLKK